jgi:hypothetical protein
LHAFEGWFCSAKLLDFPFFVIALFCTVQLWEYCINICAAIIYEITKQSHMKPNRPEIRNGTPRQRIPPLTQKALQSSK